jgi:hypothetical protein
MAKVYSVTESWYDEDGWEEIVSGVFANKEDADASATQLQLVADIKGNSHQFRVSEHEVLEQPLADVYPKKLKVVSYLTDRNTFDAIHVCDHHQDEQLRFVPLRDNEYGCGLKGKIVGEIDFDPNETNEQHEARARKLIAENFSIVPQWVLDSKDGHDKRYPQGR